MGDATPSGIATFRVAAARNGVARKSDETGKSAARRPRGVSGVPPWGSRRAISAGCANRTAFGALVRSARSIHIRPRSATKCPEHLRALPGQIWACRVDDSNAPNGASIARSVQIVRTGRQPPPPRTTLGRRAADLPVSSLLRTAPFCAAAARNVAIPLGTASLIHRNARCAPAL